jgi:glycosyltransferase involved in cell wall biosynthesis
MKIAVNLLPFREKLAGAGRYAQKIVSELIRLDKNNNYFLFISHKGKINFPISSPNMKFITSNFNPDSVWKRIFYEQFIFPFKLKKLKPDIIFTPSVAIPLFYNGRFFTTIHDIAYKKIKNKYPLLRRLYVSWVTKMAFRKSEVVFTVSNFSKKELIEEFGIEKDILVTYNAVDDNFFIEYDEIDKRKFNEKYNLPDNFILYVGAIEPGKNLDRLFLAFSELIKSEKDISLAITSGIRWKEKDLLNLIYKLGISDKIIYLPYIEESELPLLYKNAKLLAYLSSYEGFGLPVLEAMSAGTPVVTSYSAAIKEFSDSKVNMVNPNNIDEVVATFKSIIKNNNEVSNKIIEAKKVAQNFRWKNSAQIILESFNKVVK